MKALLDKKEFEKLLAREAVVAINQAGIGNQSGQLRNTLTVESTPEGYVLEFEPYGLYVDSGVQGIKSGASGRGFEGNFYKFSGRYKMIGGRLGGRGSAGYAIRTSIYNRGIAAQPWIDRALDLITQTGAELMEKQITENIEATVTQDFPRTQITITL